MTKEKVLNKAGLEIVKDEVGNMIPTSLPASDVYSWAKAETKPIYTATEVGADKAGAANTALTAAKAYTDTAITGLLVPTVFVEGHIPINMTTTEQYDEIELTAKWSYIVSIKNESIPKTALLIATAHGAGISLFRLTDEDTYTKVDVISMSSIAIYASNASHINYVIYKCPF